MKDTSRARSASIVLHVEDDQALAGAIKSLLEIAGHVAISATGSADAIAQLTRTGIRPDVLIVDYRLASSETGTDVAEQIASLVGHSIPTIVLTGDLVNAEVPWMPGAPMMLVAKPVDASTLLETIEHFTSLHHAVRAPWDQGRGVPR
ncbi:MAG: response regulator [Steroidobacteraceae bacterium]|nr:response regulator [Steroidobacteraceae bacterium]MDW8260416.1 response regulator [Gammaproteobacteria bacterium]